MMRASVETSQGELGFLVRSKDPDGKKADVVWEFECSAPRLRQHWLAVINAVCLSRVSVPEALFALGSPSMCVPQGHRLVHQIAVST